MFNLGKLSYGVSIDTQDAEKQLQSFDKRMKTVGGNLEKFGKTLTKNITLPIVAAGGFALKSASDFEVASRKYGGAFKGAEKEAAAALENLNKNFGIANSEGTKLLAFTGDLLKGFGATSQEALELSESTQELSAALAAYNGVPVAQASEAITKALLGERESLKLLGVAIREEDVSIRLAQKGQEDLTGQALLLAKAQATLELSAEQSADAINNFASNTDTAAFQSATLLADVKDIAVQLGTVMLPVFKEVVGQIKEWIGGLKDLDASQIENILKIAALVAAIGPAITAVGTLTKVVGGLQAAFAFLAANPIVAAIAGVAALSIGLGTLLAASRQKQLEELTAQFGELAKATGVADEDMKSFVKSAEYVEEALLQGSYQDAFLEAGEAATSLKDQVDIIAYQTGLSKEQVIGIALASNKVSQENKVILEQLQEEVLSQEAITAELLAQEERALGIASGETQRNKLLEINTKLVKEAAEKEAKITAEIRTQTIEREKAVKARIDARLSAEQKYTTAISEAQAKFDFGIIDSKALLEEQIAATRQQIQDLISAGYRNTDVWKETLGYKTIQEMQAALGVLEGKLEDLNQQEGEYAQARIDLDNKYETALLQRADKKEELLARERESAIAEAQKLGADVLQVEAYYDGLSEDLKEQRRLEEIDAERKKYEEIGKLALASVQQFQAIGGMIGAIYAQQAQNADAALANFEANNQAEIDALKEKEEQGIALTAAEQERLEELEKQKRELLEEQYNAQLKAFYTQKALNIADTIIAGAQAAIQAYKSLAGIPIVGPVLGAAAAATVAALTAKQVSLIRAQEPPPPPKFAEGGIVSNPGDGISAIVGEAGPEAILPLNDKTFSALGQAVAESTSAGTSPSTSGDLIINFEGNRLAIIKDGVNSLLKNRQILIPSSVVI